MLTFKEKNEVSDSILCHLATVFSMLGRSDSLSWGPMCLMSQSSTGERVLHQLLQSSQV